VRGQAAVARLGFAIAFALGLVSIVWGAGVAGAGRAGRAAHAGRTETLSRTGGAPPQGVPADAQEVVSMRSRN